MADRHHGLNEPADPRHADGTADGSPPPQTQEFLAADDGRYDAGEVCAPTGRAASR